MKKGLAQVQAKLNGSVMYPLLVQVASQGSATGNATDCAVVKGNKGIAVSNYHLVCSRVMVLPSQE